MNEPSLPSPQRPSTTMSFTLLAMAVFLLAIFAIVQTAFLNRGRTLETSPAIVPRGDLAADEKSTIELFQQASSRSSRNQADRSMVLHNRHGWKG